MKKVILFGIALLVLNSCGTNQKENERIHNERIEVGKALKKTKLRNLYKDLEKTLAIENQQLSKINQWQLGRSQLEKKSQLIKQRKVINKVKLLMTNIEHEIALTNLIKAFEFQKSPEGTVQHIFQSAKTEKYDKMRYLLDPYGEFDDDVFQICMVEMFPVEKQKEVTDYLKNGRIMGEPIVNDGVAEIEIAIGKSSNRLEKIQLVKRLDNWFLTSM